MLKISLENARENINPSYLIISIKLVFSIILNLSTGLFIFCLT